jgi:uncharacterized protein YjbI with pentapeptide repeats
VVGLLKYFDFRSRRDRASAAVQAFLSTVDALASEDNARRLAGAIMLRRFFDRSTEQGEKEAPYAKEAQGVMAALLRDIETGTLQKLLADGLSYSPSLRQADLQGCNLQNAYLGERPDRRPDLSEADLFEADLSGASLANAKACKAVFFRATMRGTVLRKADLREANFSQADLRDARFDGADLAGAVFDGAKNLPPDIEGLTHGEAHALQQTTAGTQVDGTTQRDG